MFLGFILICGLNVPGALNGCVPAASTMLFQTEKQCHEMNIGGVEHFQRQLPPGAYIADTRCFQVSQDTKG